MNHTIERWVVALETRDTALLRLTLSDSVVLVSPLTDQFTFDGADAIAELMGDVFDVLNEIEVVDHITGELETALFVRARVDDLLLEETQRIHLDATGLIDKITLYMRPIPAMTKLMRGLGPRVARRQGNPATARLLVATGALLDTVAGTGDRRFVPLAAPRT